MQKQTMSGGELAQLFAAPPLEYSDFMTYFWESGKLSKEQLSWQLEQVKARSGLCRGAANLVPLAASTRRLGLCADSEVPLFLHRPDLPNEAT